MTSLPPELFHEPKDISNFLPTGMPIEDAMRLRDEVDMAITGKNKTELLVDRVEGERQINQLTGDFGIVEYHTVSGEGIGRPRHLIRDFAKTAVSEFFKK